MGVAQKWLMENCDHDGKSCLTWPFARDTSGYGLAKIDGKSRTASRYMCILKNGTPPSQRHEAAHSCGNGNKGCVNPNHLTWKTPKQNWADRLTHGTDNRGERNNTTKLTANDVLKIRYLYSSGQIQQKELAEKFRTDVSTISDIHRRKSWAWLEQEETP
jgi:hypothetical protein